MTAGVVTLVERRGYPQSDMFHIMILRRREGIAQAAEVRKTVDTKATCALTKKIRSSRQKPHANDGAL